MKGEAEGFRVKHDQSNCRHKVFAGVYDGLVIPRAGELGNAQFGLSG
jgi:hypothetical protein